MIAKGFGSGHVLAPGSGGVGHALSGVVVKFDAERGFVRFEEGIEDAFVHISDGRGRLALVPGQHVSREVIDTPKGPAARDVVPGSVQASPSTTYPLLSAVLVAAVAAPFSRR